jgi:hypothetical protein
MPPRKTNTKDKQRGNRSAPKSTRNKKIDTICRLEDGEWYCYKMDGGQATQCSGPFDTREECETCGCEG